MQIVLGNGSRQPIQIISDHRGGDKPPRKYHVWITQQMLSMLSNSAFQNDFIQMSHAPENLDSNNGLAISLFSLATNNQPNVPPRLFEFEWYGDLWINAMALSNDGALIPEPNSVGLSIEYVRLT